MDPDDPLDDLPGPLCGPDRVAFLKKCARDHARGGESVGTMVGNLGIENAVNCEPELTLAQVTKLAMQAHDREQQRRATYHGHPPPPLLTVWAREIEVLPPPEWLIDRVLGVGGFGVLYGPSVVGKTFEALAMSVSISRQLPWHGRATRRGKVLYLVGEGVGGLPGRLRALKKHLELEGDIDVCFVSGGFSLLDQHQVTEFIEDFREDTWVLVIIDTLARYMPGGDEDSARDMGAVIAQIDRIRTALGTAVLVLHHPTKSSPKKERGSGALRGAADTMLLQSRTKDEIRITCEKQKDAEEFAEIRGRLEVVQLDDGSTSCVAVHTAGPVAAPQGSTGPPILTANRHKALVVLAKQPGGQSGPKQWEKAAGIKNREVYRAREALLQAGYVEPVPNGKGVCRITTQGKQYLEGTATDK